ncbi:MAG: hypothetical protein R6T98_08270 [Desulfatiglandales bacterium]
MTFEPNKKFKKVYDRLFAKNPAGANTWLLLQELKDEKSQIITDEQELAELLAIRFPDGLDKYAFGGPGNE